MSHNARVWGALWIVYIIWGSTYLGIKVAGETIPPVLAVATRFIAAGAIMTSVVLFRGGSMRISRRALVSVALIGALLPGANAVLFIAERHIPTGIASLLIASVPLMVVVIRLLIRERIPGWAVAGVVLGFAGVALLARPSGTATALGIGLCVLSAGMWSVGTVASARLELPADPIAATAWEMLIGGVLLLPFGIATTHHLDPSGSSILAWIYLVTIGSVVGYTAYVWLLSNAPLSTVSTYAYVNPVVAILLGMLFLDEHLNARILVGAAIVVVAVAVVVRNEPPAATQPEEGVR